MIHRDTLLALMRDTRYAIAEAKARILDDLLADLGHLATSPDEHQADDDWEATAPEPLDADEARATIAAPDRAPAGVPVDEEYAVVRAAPAVEPAPPAEPSKRPRRRTPPPPAAPPGPVEDAPVDGDGDDGFGAIPF